MGEKENPEKKNLSVSKESKDKIFIDRPITENDVTEFNNISPITITLINTKGQDPKVLAKLDKNITIRLSGSIGEDEIPENMRKIYDEKTSYSPLEVSRMVEILQGIEEQIIPEWSDLEKATYGYISLMSNIQPVNTNKEKSKEDSVDERPLARIFNSEADSFGYAIILREYLDRNGIPCKYYQNGNISAWNEILIDGEYYPADLFLDVLLNVEAIKEGSFEVKNYLSDKEFYDKKEHQIDGVKVKETKALDHSKIQNAIDNIANREQYIKEEIPPISLKSKELQKIFGTSEIKSTEEIPQIEEIKLSLEGGNVEEIQEDLAQLGKYYTNVLDNVTLSNDTGTHVDMQKIVDTIYDARNSEYTSDKSKVRPSQIIIESSVAEDFDIDFSNAPQIDDSEIAERHEDISYSQKVSFVNTSSVPLKLPSLKGKIPSRIDTISFENCDVAGFNVRDLDSKNPGRKIEFRGGGTTGIGDIKGLDSIVSLTVNGISDTEFNDVMSIAAHDATTMPNLFELNINNQRLSGRALFSEINNQNIVKLYIFNSRNG